MSEPLHPFRWLPPEHRQAPFLVSSVGTAVVMVALCVLGRGLKIGAASHGILSFEFAGDVCTAQSILCCWGKSGTVLAGFHLGLDYLFLVLYPLSIALGCSLVIAHFSRSHRAMVFGGVLLAWGQILAGALDAVENWALFQLLQGATSALLPRVAWWCAAVKFALVGSGLAFLVLASVLAITAHLRRPRGAAS